MALNRNPPKTKPAPFIHRERLGFVRLYLDDLDALLRFIRSHTSGLVVLGAGKATADEAGDLRSATPTELRKVAIVTNEPPTRVSLEFKDASVTTTEDNDAARELVGQIASLLREHRRWAGGSMLRSFGWTIGGLFYAPLLVLSAVVQIGKGDGGGWAWIVMVAVLLPMTIFLSVASWVSRKRQGGAVVLPINREEDRSRRTGWRVGIVTAIVGALVGALSTLVVQALTGR